MDDQPDDDDEVWDPEPTSYEGKLLSWHDLPDPRELPPSWLD